MRAVLLAVALSGTALPSLGAGYGGYSYSYDPGGYYLPPERLGLYFGGVYQPAVLPLDDMDYLRAGGGWLVWMGYCADVPYSPDGMVGFELAFGRSVHDDSLNGGTVAYTRLDLGLRWWESEARPAVLYLTMGTSFHDLWGNGGTDVSGWGFYGGGGVEVSPSRFVSFGVDVRVHVWGGEDRFGVVTYGLTPEVGLGLSIKF